MESRVERLQRQRRLRQEQRDQWLGRVAEALVVVSLLYLLARSPWGRSLAIRISDLLAGL